jgi:hypothetical protein
VAKRRTIKRPVVKPFSNEGVFEGIKLAVETATKAKTRDIFTKLVRTGLTRDELIAEMSGIAGNSFAVASTVIDTGLSIIGRERINDVAQELGLEWYRYIGGVIRTTRDFCEERDGGYYHKSEIEEWAGEDWDGKIEGTDADNIFTYCGGYNCRHDLIPVDTDSVPSEYKD